MRIMELKKSEYIPVQYQGTKSFGGNQCWYPTEHYLSQDYAIHKWGCGAVAIADLFLYLARADHARDTSATSLARASRLIYSYEDYTLYLKFMQRRFTPILPYAGMNGFMLAAAANHYAMKYQIPIKASWKAFLNDDQMIRAIRRMISEDIPVIISIGPNTPLFFKKEGIHFYIKSNKEDNTKLEHYSIGARNVHAHYVTVTGIVGLKNKKMLLKIASWGREFYIDYQEWREYIAQFGDRLTSSLLYVEWRS
ncbi:MAG: hypothetical protein IJ079_03040 [Lachnospiraceae bacterium]|nr:hypothetical protein [Lachnospiraceae bacterium]